MFLLKSIWPTERIDFILAKSSKVNNKCLRTFQIVVWLMSQLSQNSLAIAIHQLQGWEGVNLLLRQQGLCQQGPLHILQSQQHPRQGWSSPPCASLFPWHTQQLIAGCMALLWLIQVALLVQCSSSSALPRLPFSPSDLLGCLAEPTSPRREPGSGCHPKSWCILCLLCLGQGDPWQPCLEQNPSDPCWIQVPRPLGEGKPADASSCLLPLPTLPGQLCASD